jgi:uncharacterized membrane protein
LLGSVISTLELFCSAQPATISNAAIEACVKKVLFIGYLLFVITIYVGRSVYVRLAMNSVKLRRTRVIGAKKVLKDFKQLTKTLQDLMRKHGKSDTKKLQKAFKSVRTSITPKG